MRLHLKEYTSRELLALFKQAGFRRVQTWVGTRGRYTALPPPVITSVEAVTRLVPPDRRKRSSVLGAILCNQVHVTK